jgi:uncharacterized SAM-binding protein YcdF (DUF218 family)
MRDLETTPKIRPESKLRSKMTYGGLLTRRERWGLSGRGWLLIALLAVALTVTALLNVYPFLSVTHRVDTNMLVVEGWVHDYAIQGGIDEYGAGSYQRIFVTGGPVTGSGVYTSDYGTSAHVGESRLKALGMPAESIQAVPSRVIDRDRTYYSALALRDWFHQQAIEVHAINIVTENVHARRTRLLFAEAFGPKVAIGIIAVPDPDYEPKRWWRYSEGVKDVLSESIAYIYAKFFFYPSEAT